MVFLARRFALGGKALGAKCRIGPVSRGVQLIPFRGQTSAVDDNAFTRARFSSALF
jgi:hypothetical protein